VRAVRPVPAPGCPSASGRMSAPVVAARVELLADEPELLDRGRWRRRESWRDPYLPAHRVADLLERRARVDRSEPHLAVRIEAVDAQVGDHHGGAAAQPALLAPDAC